MASTEYHKTADVLPIVYIMAMRNSGSVVRITIKRLFAKNK